MTQHSADKVHWELLNDSLLWPRDRPIDVGHMQGLTHSDMFDSDIDRGQRRSLTMERKVGDDVAVGPLWLGHYIHQTAYPTAKVIRASLYNACA